MTRRNASDELDGSSLKCKFSNGYIKDRDGISWTWDENFVDQSETGYDAHGGTRADAKDVVIGNSVSRLSKYKVLFPSLDVSLEIGRSDIPASYGANEDGLSRYINETVEINLRMGVQAVGKSIVPAH